MDYVTDNVIWDFALKVCRIVFNFGTSLVDVMNTSISDLLTPFQNVPIFGDIIGALNDFVVWIVTALIDEPDAEITLLEFMFGVGLPLVVAITFVIWVLNIIT